MGKLGISKSILSITSPGTHLKAFEDQLALKVTRETNEEISQICQAHPEKFAFFASLPLPDVQGSIEEIDHALDHQRAVGFALMTNAHGYYLGDARLDPVFAKLNERQAIVFMHPTSCHSPHSPEAERPLSQYPAPVLEFFFDTTRAVVNLILSGTVTRYPDITYLVSHCGGALPPLIERFSSFSSIILEGGGSGGGVNSSQVKDLFKSRFYFDLAGFPFPDQIHGLLRATDASRLLYGSDFPYTPASALPAMGSRMDEALAELFDEETIRKVYSGNAKRLLNI
jgi:predicted TIM-barrel fold metal-dependent hydrolase